VWDDCAIGTIVATTSDPSWRVREMAAKVIARHHVQPAIDEIMALLNDQNARVRAAAHRAFEAIVNDE
jgi:HEAT repeat protein